MSKLASILLLMLLPISISAQEDGRLLGHIKHYVEDTYQVQGESPIFIFRKIKLFDRQGKAVQEQYWEENKNGQLYIAYTVEYKYDNQGREVEQMAYYLQPADSTYAPSPLYKTSYSEKSYSLTEFDMDGGILFQQTYQLDSENRKIAAISEGGKTTYSYNADGSLAKRTLFNNQGEAIVTYEYMYDEGNYVVFEILHGSPSPEEVVGCEGYDKNDNLMVASRWTFDSNSMEKEREFHYEFDPTGNWTYKMEYKIVNKNSILVAASSRELTYYENNEDVK